MVKLMIIGVARTNCPMTMAVGVKSNSNGPKGPRRDISAYPNKPTTTVGSAIKVLRTVIIIPRPLNVLIPIVKPAGIPASEASRIAINEILSEVKVITKISRSRVIINLKACNNACQR